MRTNLAFFRNNGACGYVLKPDWLRRPELNTARVYNRLTLDVYGLTTAQYVTNPAIHAVCSASGTSARGSAAPTRPHPPRAPGTRAPPLPFGSPGGRLGGLCTAAVVLTVAFSTSTLLHYRYTGNIKIDVQLWGLRA